MYQIPFQLIDWGQIERTEHPGSSGTSFCQTLQLEGLRIRLVEYCPGYLADHWCRLGHLAHCLEGSFITELISGEKRELSAGQSYIVSDDLSEHRSSTQDGVKLLIVDGEFLRK